MALHDWRVVRHGGAACRRLKDCCSGVEAPSLSRSLVFTSVTGECGPSLKRHTFQPAVAGVRWRSMIGCVLLPVGRSSWFEMRRAVLRNQDAAEGFVGTMA